MGLPEPNPAAREQRQIAMEDAAYEWVRPRLRPRLRWALHVPHAMTVLRWLKLWEPTKLHFVRDEDDGLVTELHFVTTRRRVPERLVWDPTELRFTEAPK